MAAAMLPAFLWTLTPLSAQKMGYLNSLALLSQMPQVAQADTAVMRMRDSLYVEGQVRAKLLQDKYTALVKDVNEGSVPPREAQLREEEVMKGQQELEKYQQEISAWLGAQREKLYDPILDQLQKAIDEVGTEHSFQFIFDVSSLNFIVYAEESVDVTPLVKAKLGLP